jgi:hypothetical protein
LTNFDISGTAGGTYKGIVQTVRRATDGTLNLDVVNRVHGPFISGIEIVGPN